MKKNIKIKPKVEVKEEIELDLESVKEEEVKLKKNNLVKILTLVLGGLVLMGIVGLGVWGFMSKVNNRERKDNKIIEINPQQTELPVSKNDYDNLNNEDSSQESKNLISPKLLDTTNWGTGISKNISFKFPQGYIFSEQYGNAVLVSNNYNPPEVILWITINTYDGGSRRQWLINRLKGINFKDDYIQQIKFREIRLGSVDALEAIFPDNNSHILVANKSTILEFSLNFTGLVRNQTIDSIISTIKFSDFEANDSESMRWSATRKTVWERQDLGLKVTAPEWIESRLPKKWDESGKMIEFYDWVKIYPKAYVIDPTDETKGISVQVCSGPSCEHYLYYVDKKFNGQTFDSVVNEILPGGGGCSMTSRTSKSECGDTPLEYCYTKEDVLNNLLLIETTKFGPYDAQLRGINQEFSQKKDCGGEQTWLIKAKGGQFVLSTISNISDVVRLEGF